MLIPAEVLQLLVEAGVSVSAEQSRGRGDHGVDLVLAPPGRDDRYSFQIKTFTQPVSPKMVAGLVAHRPPTAGGLLVVAASASTDVRDRAVELGVSLIALNRERALGPNGHLVLGPGDVLPLGQMSPPPPAASRRRSWGTSLVVHALLLHSGRTQGEVAALAGVSQPRVSQIFKELTAKQLIEPGHRSHAKGWRIQNWDGLLDHWLTLYPGPGGVTTFWYGLDTPSQQARAVIDHLAATERTSAANSKETNVLVSGDVAADVLAPGARPQRAIVYARRGTDLTDLGMTPSPEAQATMLLVVPEDPGVWAMARHAWWRTDSSGFPAADPLQVLWDLRNSPGPDANQAAAHFTGWLRHELARRLGVGHTTIGNELDQTTP